LSVELYEQPKSEISQGDILEVAPNIFLAPPLTALYRSENGLHRSEVEPFSSFDNEGQNIIAMCKRTKAIVLTHDCEIDKKQVTRWQLCPVVPLSRLKPENQDRVKRNRIYSMFYLPRHADILSFDSFVDFSQISTVGSEFINDGKRIVSLSDVGRRGLYAQFVRWLTRWELRELTCPNCGVDFNPTTSLSVR
jgi:hypothetical protein